MRALLVEDEPDLRARVAAVLGRAGYVVDTAGDGEDADFLVKTEPYGLIVLDLGLPKVDGMTLLRQWRGAGQKTPILVLTARDTWRDRVDALRAGADDHMGKPFETEELLARAEALIRRTHGHAAPVLRVGPVAIDPARRQVTRDGAEVPLTALEYRTLHFLALNQGRVVPQEELMEHLYASGLEAGSNVMEVIVSRLRKKLGAGIIETRRGHGYVIADPA